MKTKKRVKIFIIILSPILIIAAILYTVYFSLTHVDNYNLEIAGGSSDNNSYMNTCANMISCLARIGDKLYYNAANDFFKYGTYEIASDSTRRIYWQGPSVSGSFIDLDCVSQDNIFLPYITSDGAVEYYDIADGSYKNYLNLSQADAKSVNSLAVNGGELYYLNDRSTDNYITYDLYKNGNNGLEKVLSAENFSFDRISQPRFYGDYIYFTADKRLSDNENSDTRQYVCKYDPNAEKIISQVLCYEGGKENGVKERFDCSAAVENKVYGIASVDGYDYVYCANLKNQSVDLIFKSDGSTIINSYGDSVFMCVQNGSDKGIYRIGTSTNEVEKIFDKDMDINGLYIVDSQYLYFTDDAYFGLYRITWDGGKLEKVFG